MMMMAMEWGHLRARSQRPPGHAAHRSLLPGKMRKGRSGKQPLDDAHTHTHTRGKGKRGRRGIPVAVEQTDRGVKTHELLVVHGLDGSVSRRLVGKGDKAEAARATRARLTV